jgi:hypothetical protein
MKKFIAVLAVAAFSAVLQAGPTIKMLQDSTPAYQFKILEDGFGGYAAETILSTFCLEVSETFTTGTSYSAVIGTAAVTGGKDWAGGVYGQEPLATVVSDPLDPRTAFLFTRFMEGDSRLTDEIMLQNAIHYIEAESTTSNSYVTLADAAVAEGGEWYGMELGNVRVMTLWTTMEAPSCYSGYAQDQLILVNAVPEPGTLALVGIGMALAGRLRRRREL